MSELEVCAIRLGLVVRVRVRVRVHYVHACIGAEAD